MAMEIELNFRLDEHGRTSKSPPSAAAAAAAAGGEEESSSAAGEDPNKKIPAHYEAGLDYASKTVLTNLAPSLSPFTSSQDENRHQQWLDDLLFDCQISDSGLMPRTFWVPADGMTPRCQLEQMALDVFHHHVSSSSSLDYDKSTSGAEWWAQIRPSPEGTGRYSMHDDQPDELSQTGISFHWDKDEDLRLLTGGTTYIHPHLSTVTYLTDLGAPTFALNHRVHNITGEWIGPASDTADVDVDVDVVEGFVSWPRTGKHLSFDGRYLHAAPMDLMEPGAWEKQLELPQPPLPTASSSSSSDKDDGGQPAAAQDPQEIKLLKRRHRRVTFLVNIWLNYKPFDIKPFPDTMIDKMSGNEEATRRRLEFVEGDVADTQTQILSSSDVGTKRTWPMGDCDSKEFIEAQMPIQEIRKQALTGGNVRLKWKPCKEEGFSGVRLYKETITITSHTESGELGDSSDKRNAESEPDASGDATKRLKT